MSAAPPHGDGAFDPFAAVDIPGWAPPVFLSDRVRGGARLDTFLARLPAGYRAAAARFAAPEPLLVSGRHFAVVTRAGGLSEASIHTLGPHDWHQLFAAIRTVRSHATGGPAPIVAAGAGHANHYHWLIETGAAMALAALRDPQGLTPLVVPAMTAAQRALPALLGLAHPLIEIGADEAGAFDAAVVTNCIGRDTGLAPHPGVLARIRAAAGLGARAGRRLVYLGRLDAPGRRGMGNEAALAARLAARGFEIVAAGALPLAEQAAIVRDAAVIVAPHGAALANLVFAGDGAGGPAVIELLGEAYPSRVYARLCQAKRLDYCAIVHPAADPAGAHHATPWEADIALVERVLDAPDLRGWCGTA